MKKLKVLLFVIMSFLLFSSSVYARVYTNEDVENYINVVLDHMNYLYDENVTYNVNNGNVTFTKVTKSGDIYTTEYLYNNGTYTFNTKLPSVNTDQDRLQNLYDFLAAFTMVNAIVSIYDDETAREVADVVVSSELDNDHLSLEKHGAIWIDSPIPAIPFIMDNGYESTIDGHIQNIVIDINNQKFIKLATTLDEPGENPLEQIIVIEITDEELKPEEKPSENENTGGNGGTTGSGSTSGKDEGSTSTDKPGSGNNDSTGDTSSNTDKNDDSINTPNSPKPDTDKGNSDKDSSQQTTINNNNTSYESENDMNNETPDLVENPKTGVYTSITAIIVAIAGVLGLGYLNKNKILKKL